MSEASMVERVAKVLCDDTLKRWRTPIGVKAEPWREFIPAARAAIEAMREPTEKMSDAGEKAIYDLSRYIAEGAYQAMIDTALNEKEPQE